MEDASLEEFAGGPGGDASERPAALATYAFDPTGAACEECGETVTRRWREDGAMVCPACKGWSE